MIVFAVAGILIFTVIACVGLVCAHYDSDDLRRMGIRLFCYESKRVLNNSTANRIIIIMAFRARRVHQVDSVTIPAGCAGMVDTHK